MTVAVVLGSFHVEDEDQHDDEDGFQKKRLKNI
jgi:hypothetical protein